jgi:pimeloyl-ACP methyl ester carboxylesterase
MSRSHWLGTRLLILLLLIISASPAAQAEVIAMLSTAGTDSLALRAPPGCPNNSGLLDSVSVPVNQPLELTIIISSAQAGAVRYQLASDNPALVAVGDRLGGFLPIVTVPAGQTISNTFRVFGIKVGRTTLRVTPLTSGFIGFTTPITAWDLNPGAPVNTKFVDANPPANSCRVNDTSIVFSRDATKIASCGKPVMGTSADGLSRLLLRVGAGIGGTACYEIVSTSAGDQGQLDAAVVPLSSAANGLHFAPSYLTAPRNYGNINGVRQIEVELSFTPNIGNGNTSRVRYKTEIARPPVVLVHGLWGSSSSFDKWPSYASNSRSLNIVNYIDTNASGFYANSNVLAPAIDHALEQHRISYASTRVDIVAHSMGGILSRLHIGSAAFRKPQNLNEGDVRRLLTLVTPHYGSSFANLLIALHRENPADTASTVRDIVRGEMAGGAVCDLAENSAGFRLPILAAGTVLRSQVFTATGGPPGTPTGGLFFEGRFFRGNLEGALTQRLCNLRSDRGACLIQGPFIFPQQTVNAFRFRERNDTVVAFRSQSGGVTPEGSNFPTLIHSSPLAPVGGMTNRSEVATAAFALLDGPDSGFASSLGPIPSDGDGTPETVPGRGVALDRADYASQCGPGGPLTTMPVRTMSASTDLSISSPVEGSTFVVGNEIRIIGQLATNFEPTDLGFSLGEGIGYIEATTRNDRLFERRYTLPVGLAGRVTITPVARNNQGGLIEGAAVTVNILPQGTLAELSFVQPTYSIPPTAPAQQLALTGRFTSQPVDESVDLTSSGASFTSSNNAVVSVNAAGRVTVAGAGLASVSASFLGRTAYATFIVGNPVQPLPPQELTTRFGVSFSGFQLNRNTGFYVQTLTLVNNSQSVLSAPLFLTINNLTTNVSVVGDTVGQTVNIPSPETPYLSLPLPNQQLAPGQRVSVQLQFLNVTRTRISYSPKVYWTNAQP